ncbi:hypothetical protein [Sporomusa sp.]|uniref:hypothetical protein n=1 Tax=Sporomusa sp. TaxID=2078658 RepID=UPI002C44EE79|nr:hypothetical protein [Sporomusa sp.]HWR42803.1 hypothetical protein [Sporomusa sp.]
MSDKSVGEHILQIVMIVIGGIIIGRVLLRFELGLIGYQVSSASPLILFIIKVLLLLTLFILFARGIFIIRELLIQQQTDTQKIELLGIVSLAIIAGIFFVFFAIERFIMIKMIWLMFGSYYGMWSVIEFLNKTFVVALIVSVLVSVFYYIKNLDCSERNTESENQ